MQVENTPQVTPLPPCSAVLPLASLPLVSFVPQFLILFSYHQCIDDFLLSLKSRTHKGHLQCLSFWDWHNSLNVIISCFIHFLSNHLTSFFSVTERKKKFHCVYKPHSLYPVAFSCIPRLLLPNSAIVRNAMMSGDVQGIFVMCWLRGLWVNTQERIAGSYGRSIVMFLTKLHTDFHSGWTSFVPSSRVVHTGTLFSTAWPVFVISGDCLSDRVRWNPSVAGLCAHAGHPRMSFFTCVSTLSPIDLKLAD